MKEKLVLIWGKIKPYAMKDYVFKGWQIAVFAVVLAVAKILFF
jgi:hypothetical protein